MGKVICIGEALIDFMPSQSGRLQAVTSFEKCPGGAPANVAACVARLGIPSVVLTMLGRDPFGDFLVESMAAAGIDISRIARTSEANTALAFVSHSDDGDRDFLFYRNPSADMLLSPGNVPEDCFEAGDILHFCSVDLVDAPCRRAHDRAIEIAKKKGCTISFDVNLRFPLWNDAQELKETVLRYIPFADIVKVSDEELEFLGPISAPHLIVTKGKNGACLDDVFVQGFDTPAVDTTGAGDAFIGSFLAQLQQGKPLSPELLRYCHAVSSVVVAQKGAIAVMPTPAQVDEFLAVHG